MQQITKFELHWLANFSPALLIASTIESGDDNTSAINRENSSSSYEIPLTAWSAQISVSVKASKIVQKKGKNPPSPRHYRRKRSQTHLVSSRRLIFHVEQRSHLTAFPTRFSSLMIHRVVASFSNVFVYILCFHRESRENIHTARPGRDIQHRIALKYPAREIFLHRNIHFPRRVGCFRPTRRNIATSGVCRRAMSG